MSDPERGLREEVRVELAGAGEFAAEALVRASDGRRIRADILIRPSPPALAAFSIVVETKLRPTILDRDLAPWIKQASDYVGAVPESGWPPVAASFVWIGRQTLADRERERMLGMLQLAQHFRVGQGYVDDSGIAYIVFGQGIELFSRNHGWRPRSAEYLGARRVVAGTRRRLPPP